MVQLEIHLEDLEAQLKVLEIEVQLDVTDLYMGDTQHVIV